MQHRHRPPQYHTSFVGRRPEIARLRAALSEGSLVSLVGPGGVGKTRLASECVAGLAVCFIDLSSARSESEAASAVLQATGSVERPSPGRDLVSLAAEELARLPADVILLDNLEQLSGAAPFVSALRERAPGRRWLVTSRSPLGCGEDQIDLLPFDVAGEARDAIDLFLRVASPSASSALQGERERLARMLAALDGLPLCIELCAARTAVLALDEIEQRLYDPLRLLVDPSRPEDKGSALWRSISWSVELLSPGARRTLARISVFAAPLDADAACAIAGDGARYDLVELTKASLLREEDGRYRPYEVVARFAERLLETIGEEPDATLAHARWCWARSANLEGEGFREYETLGADVEAAERRAESAPPGAELRSLGQRLFCRWQEVHDARLPWEALAARCERLAPLVDDENTARIRIRWSMAMYRMRRIGEVKGPMEQLVSFTRAHGLDEQLVVGLSHLADVAEGEFRYDQLEALMREAIAIARRRGDTKLELQLLLGPINMPLLYNGRHDEILENLERAAVVSSDIPHMAHLIATRSAVVWLEKGRWERVEAVIQSMPDTQDLRPNTQMSLRRVKAKLALASHPRPIEVLSVLLAEPHGDGLLEVLGWAAKTLAGTHDLSKLEASVAELAANSNRGMCELRVLLEAAAAARGRIPGPLEDRRMPTLSSCTDALALLRRCTLGEIPPARALAELASVKPVCWEVLFIGRVLGDQAAAHRRAAVGPEGEWFEREGVRIVVDHPLSRRLLRALAEDARRSGPGLDVAALFSAGWPGEGLVKGADNRVRVALTKLRQTGIPVRFQHKQGWSLDVEGMRD